MGYLLCLCAIVKDEESAIARTLASVKGIADKWRVLDTGSRDATREVIARELASAGVTGHLHSGEFLDYATARNDVLGMERAGLCSRDFKCEETYCTPAKWALSLSADEVLVGGEALRSFLASYEGAESALLLEVRTPGGAFDYPRILRVGSRWRYEGEIHEEPVDEGDRAAVPTVKVPGCRVEYAPTDPERLAKRLRERDVPLMEKRFRTEPDPVRRARAAVLLGEAREQLAAAAGDDVTSASQEMFSALGWYSLLSMSEWAPAEARKRAAWRYLNAAEVLGVYLPREMVPRLQYALREDPCNPAVAYMLARHVADIDFDGTIRGDARAGLAVASRAAQVARDAVADPAKPHDPHGLLWRSHYIAAVCARALGHGPAAKKAAQAGIQGGGPREAFEQFIK